MFTDITHILAALAIQSLFWLAPGFLLAHALDLLDFRSLRRSRQLAIAMALSLGVMPIALHLLSRDFGLPVAKWIVVPLGAIVIVQLVRSRFRLTRGICVTAAVWIALAIAATLSLKIGGNLYGPVSWYDYTKHTAITSAIERTGVPPISPYFHPGRPVQLFYYYLWFLMVAASDALSGGWIGPAAAVVGAMIWTGAALMGTVVLLADRLLPKQRRGGTVAAIALLLITGVDILPTVISDLARSLHGQPGLSNSVERWNDQVTGFLASMIWVPHHVGSAVAGFAGILLLRSRHWSGTILAGVCLASCAGMSLYVACVFAAFLVVHAIVSTLNRKREEVANLCKCGAVAFVLAVPFLWELVNANQSTHQMIAIHIRDFWPALRGLNALHVTSPIIRQIVSLLCLPLNWGMELGFFAIAAIIYWRWRRQNGEPISDDERFFLTLMWTSLIIATLCKSIVHDNDFGWRACIPAQVLLLVWSILPASELFRRRVDDRVAEVQPIFRSHLSRRFAAMLLVLGFSSTLYDMVLLRFTDVLQNSGGSGERSLAARETYRWIDQHLFPSAIIQANPDVPIELFDGLYGNRQVAAVGEYYGTMYGVPPEMYRPIHTNIAPIFTNLSQPETAQVCKRYGIDALVIADTDAVWKNRDNWIARQTPLFANSHFKVIAAPLVDDQGSAARAW